MHEGGNKAHPYLEVVVKFKELGRAYIQEHCPSCD